MNKEYIVKSNEEFQKIIQTGRKISRPFFRLFYVTNKLNHYLLVARA